MIPLSLSLRNFLSYGEEVPPLDFTQFHVACLTGGNGHGKSALLDGITYALWGQARKSRSDEELCRIGAKEMRVDFDFALGEKHFRVIRSWRRTKRGVPALDLQVESDGVFRTLSEGEGINPTQRRINELLSMDYDTFVNSAFIVQGRADEFTQKNARQRKEVLGRILGLGRYDQLQGMARVRYQQHQRQSETLQARLGELDAELAKREGYEAELRAVDDRLALLGSEISSREKVQAELETQRLELVQIHQRVAELEREQQRVAERAQQVSAELEDLRAQQRQDSEILAAAESIERDFATYSQLRTQIGLLEQKAQEHGELEARRRQLEEQIAQARQEVERQQERWAATLGERQRQLAEHQALLNREQTIAIRYAQFKNFSEQAQALEQARIRYEDLLRECRDLENVLYRAEQDRKSQRQVLTKRSEQLSRTIAEEKTLAARIHQLQAQQTQLQAKAEERDRLADEGRDLNAQITERQQKLRAEEKELANERQQTQALADSDDANCPLCGSTLDAEHRQQVAAELLQREERRQERIAVLGSELATLDDQLQKMRTHYKVLGEEIAPLQQVHRELATEEARLGQLRESATEVESLAEQLAALDRELSDQSYAPSERERLSKLAGEIELLGYSSTEHEALGQKLAALRPVEAEYSRLQDAKSQADRLKSERAEAQNQLERADRQLSETHYAQEEREQLGQVEQQIAALGYDSAEHQRLRQQQDDLHYSARQFERLQHARERRASFGESLVRYEAEASTLAEQLQTIKEEEEKLHERADELEGVDRRLGENQALLEKLRAERDQHLQRRGSLEALCSRCAELAQERDELRQDLQGTQRQAWIYQQLDKAFGKDGIQALIIENAVPQIAEEANAILARLTDNRIQVSFESLRDLKKGGTRETLDVKIADEVGERSYHLYSGGEAFRTNFALRIALSKVLAMRSGTRLHTLFIDEGFGTQDEQGLEQLIEAIQKISEDFKKVLIVTHLDQLKAAFPVQIEVAKHPDSGSRFSVTQHA
ncbi:MAG: SMC family ATPase [Gemmatimonadota bacterium]|nr:SMC family ATPase [Gemmatimonadota bacterium]